MVEDGRSGETRTAVNLRYHPLIIIGRCRWHREAKCAATAEVTAAVSMHPFQRHSPWKYCDAAKYYQGCAAVIYKKRNRCD